MRGPGKIVIVRTGEPIASVAARRGQFADLIVGAIGDAWDAGYDVFDARTDDPPAPEVAVAFVITGSAANVPHREPWMLRAEAWLRDVVRAGIPTLGICFGHQMLAQALGGEVTKNPRGREIGTVRIERRGDDPMFDGIPARFEAHATHVDTVAALPPGAVSLAWSERDDHQVIRFAPACYGVQFHPELDREIMLEYLHLRRELLCAERLDVDALVAAVTDAEPGRRALQNFVRYVVPAGRKAPATAD